MSEEKYEDMIEIYSDQSQKYDGPYNVLEVSATILNSHVLEAQTLRQATVFQWDKAKYQSELIAKQKHADEKTEVFVSFYTPDKKTSDLARTDTLWKLILKFNGKEYQGSPKKLTGLPVEIKSLYPRHTRWGTPYLLSFDIPTKEAEKQIAELILTGPAGNTILKFHAVNSTQTN